VAAGLSAVEGLVLGLYGLALIPTLSGERLVMGATSVLFFLLYGGFLVFFAWRLYRLESWARSPIVLAQLIQILLGVTWGEAVMDVVLVVPAAVVLLGVFHPASLRALSPEETD
jgi:hypothetical protein